MGQRGSSRVLVDEHRDSIRIQATNIPGDHFQKRHDFIKMILYNICKVAGLPLETQVYNLFSRLISQQGLTFSHAIRATGRGSRSSQTYG